MLELENPMHPCSTQARIEPQSQAIVFYYFGYASDLSECNDWPKLRQLRHYGLQPDTVRLGPRGGRPLRV